MENEEGVKVQESRQERAPCYMLIGLNTRGYVTSRKVASQKVIIGVAHFVSQKETKRMAMHVYDMPSQCDGLIYYMVKKAKDIACRKRKCTSVARLPTRISQGGE